MDEAHGESLTSFNLSMLRLPSLLDILGSALGSDDEAVGAAQVVLEGSRALRDDPKACDSSRTPSARGRRPEEPKARRADGGQVCGATYDSSRVPSSRCCGR